MKPMIEIAGISKKYRLGSRVPYKTLRESLMNVFRKSSRPDGRSHVREENTFWALKDISFTVERGDVVGIIGRNGAGKSTLLKILSRITEPTKGEIRLRGRVSSLLEVGTGFHAELTGRENIFLSGVILGMAKEEIRRKFDAIVAFAEIEKFIDTPVKRYSSGMYVRLAFAVAAHLEPEILIVDEVLAVGDVQFQRKCLGKMEEVGKQGQTVLFVSHNMGAIKNLCTRAILLKDGQKVSEGDVSSVISTYMESGSEGRDVVSWSAGKAPSTPSAKLLEVGVLSEGARVGSEVSTEKPIDVYIRFHVNKPARVGTSVLFYNSEGQHVFTSISNHEATWHGKTRPPGYYKSICRITPNILSGGRYSVGIALWEGFYEAGTVERDVLYITAQEEGFVLGDLPYEGKGIIRPLFQWHSFSETL